jgi:hypothetical protein
MLMDVCQTSADLVSIEEDLQALAAAKDQWAKTSIQARIQILSDIKEALMRVAPGWAEAAARKKRIPAGSPLAGEEWMSGPYSVMAMCKRIGISTT